MIDLLSVDQLRMFAAIVEEGSFSAAGRRLGRVQSAVSQAIGNAERQLGLKLFDRRQRKPSLTPEGAALLVEARRVLAELDGLYAHARQMRDGVESEVSLVFDVVFPMPALVALCRRLRDEYPTVPLRVGAETLGAVARRVEDGEYALGLVGPGAGASPRLERIHVGTVRMVPVVAPSHPLAEAESPIGTARLRREVQIVLSSRDEEPTPDIAVLGDRTWRVVDLSTKHEMLRAGLGWGNLPQPRVTEDLRDGRLRQLRLASWGEDEHLLSLAAVHRRDRPPGPIGRWIIETLPSLCTTPEGHDPTPEGRA